MEVRRRGLREKAPSLLRVRAVETDDDRVVDTHLPECLQDPARDLVAAGDAAEDVEEDRPNLLVARDHAERVDDALRVSPAPEVAEVRRAPADEGHDVDRGHGEPGAVAEDADLAVELHVRDALLPRHPLERVELGHVPHLRDVGMPEERVVVHGELRVERQYLDAGLALRRDDQRVDLAEHRLAADERLVELPDDRCDLLLLRGILDAGLVDEPARLPGVMSLERIDVEPRRAPPASSRRPPRCPRPPRS